ncbi:MAG TPA: hypothetical protein VHX14_00660, partial [Thermoanaerobaculia bacterium]|nr:hypothetical protein [Thermoanaerobaculia bacterium]
RQRVRRSAATMPVVERQGGAPIQLANEAAPHTPLGEAGRALFARMRQPASLLVLPMCERAEPDR